MKKDDNKNSNEYSAADSNNNKNMKNRKEKPKKVRNAKRSTSDKLHSFALGMQRGSNEAAVLQAKNTEGFFRGLFINALGQTLYEIGFWAEYNAIKLYRALKYIALVVFAVMLAIFRSVMRPVGDFFVGIYRDLTRPIYKVFRNINKNVRIFTKALKSGKNPFKAMLKAESNIVNKEKRSFLVALSYFLPLVSILILVFTINSTLSTPFSLAVVYNSELIGYIESDSVWDDAENKVESRVRAAHADQSFQTNPTFEVVSVNTSARLTSTQLADRIVERSSDQIKQATGVYAGETLVAVCEDEAAVRDLLDTTLAIATPTDDETARVEFVHNLYMESGLYYTESITSYAQFESTLNTGGYLQTQITLTQTREIEVPYPEEEYESDQYAKGTTRVGQYGKNGVNSLTEDVTYIDGVEVARVILSEQVISEPTPKITYIGIAENVVGTGTYDGEIAAGSGTLAWPVPTYERTTTEFIVSNGYVVHRGLDITGSITTPIHACDSGTVVEAGWHWSWGYYILINHGNGMTTRYAHCSRLDVAPGTNVVKGQQIAMMGNTGVSFGDHLHLEIEVNGSLVNPRNYLVQP